MDTLSISLHSRRLCFFSMSLWPNATVSICRAEVLLGKLNKAQQTSLSSLTVTYYSKSTSETQYPEQDPLNNMASWSPTQLSFVPPSLSLAYSLPLSCFIRTMAPLSDTEPRMCPNVADWVRSKSQANSELALCECVCEKQRETERVVIALYTFPPL